MNYYNHHIGDYAKDTKHLNLMEHGAYRALIDLYYTDEGPLPGDINEICRKVCARTVEERATVVSILEEFFFKQEVQGKPDLFPRAGGGATPLTFAHLYRHRRCEKELANYRKRISISKTNGLKGGRPKTKAKPSGFLEKTQRVSEKNPPIPNPKNQSQEPEANPVAPVRVEFESPNLTTEPQNQNQAPTPKKPAPTLPCWVPVETWEFYKEHRRRIRKPMTDHAQNLALKKLKRLIESGHGTADEILNQSIERGWLGLFEFQRGDTNGNGHRNGNGNGHGRKSTDDIFRHNLEVTRRHM